MAVFDSGFTNVSILLDVPFPSNAVSGPGVSIDKTDSVWEVGLDFPDLVDGGTPATPSNVYLAGYDTGLGIYQKLRLDNVIAGATGLDSRTPRGDADYSITVNDRLVALTATLTAVRTWTLPAASTVPGGRTITIQDEGGGISAASHLLFSPTGADTIDGFTGWRLKAKFGGLTFRSNGTNKWSIAATWQVSAIADAPYTATVGDQVVAYTSITAARIVTLPAAGSYPIGQRLTIIDFSGSCNDTKTITATRAGADLINGATSQVITTAFGFVTMVSDGTSKWTVTDASFGNFGPISITSTSQNAFTVGANGATNPALRVDNSIASAATGLHFRPLAAGSSMLIQTLSSAPNEGLVIDAKGTGVVLLGGNSSGGVTLASGGGPVTISPANGTVSIQPSGTGVVTIAPAGSGTMDNVTIGATTPKPATVTSLNSGSLGGFRNRLINGDFSIDQPNAGLSVYTVNTGTVQCMDGWVANGLGAAGVFTVQQVLSTSPPGASSYARVIVTTADAAPGAATPYQLSQRVEGTSVRDLAFGTSLAKTITLSFLVRTSITGTFSGALRNSGGTRSWPFSFTVAAANTWTQIQTTITGDLTGTWLTDNTSAWFLGLDLGSGSNFTSTAGTWQAGNFLAVTGGTKLISTLNATYDISNVQVEVGSVATPFEARPYDLELRLCKRRYQKSFSIATAPAQNIGIGTGEFLDGASIAGATVNRLARVHFEAEMRATPTMTLFNPSAANAQARDITTGGDCTVTTTFGITAKGFAVFATGNAATAVGNYIGFHWVADARL